MVSGVGVNWDLCRRFAGLNDAIEPCFCLTPILNCMKSFLKSSLIVAAVAVFACTSAQAASVLLASVDFTNPDTGGFDRTPTNEAPALVTTSSGNNSSIGLFQGWTLINNAGNFAAGALNQDGGATAAGASSGNFPARLEGRGSFSITLNPDHILLGLDRIEFDARAATGADSRGFVFTTNREDPGTVLLSESPLRGRNNPAGWETFSVDLSGPNYQNLVAGDTIEFIWDTSTGAPGHGATDIDSIQVFGTVPEPTRAMLFAVGLLVLLRRRR